MPWLVAFLGLLFAPLRSSGTIRYAVSVAERDEHKFHVTMTIPDVRNELIVRIPAWNALYQIRDFAHHVLKVRARLVAAGSAASVTSGTNPGAPLAVKKCDKQTWRLAGDGVVALDYSVHWDEPGPFSSQLDRHHAFINLAEILFYVPERRSEDVEVFFTDLAPSWKIAVELPAAQTPNSFRAANYDDLVDAPVEISAFKEFALEANGARVRVVVDAESWDRAELEKVVTSVVSYETALMREVPFAEYLFLYHFGTRIGGMEHANSTAIAAQDVLAGANTTAHEFFHLWNVKRVRPQSLEPVDYTREQWTRALWFVEGVTSTYGAYTLVRSGVWSRQGFYQDLAEQIGTLESRPAHKWQSVEQSSLDAWLEKYPFYHRPDVSISYYNKGQIVGVLLDLLIRDVSDNHASLDDVVRSLNQDFAHRGRFYNDTEDIRATAERIAGRSLKDFFDRYVSGTEEIPYDDFLSRAGLVLQIREGKEAGFGFLTGAGPGGAGTVVEVGRGSPAARAGVREGDVALELNGRPFPAHSERWLREHQPGEVVHLRVRRGATEMTFSFPLEGWQRAAYEIVEQEKPTDKQRRIREGLLRGTVE